MKQATSSRRKSARAISKSGEVADEVAKALYYDGLPLTDVKLREQAVPPPAVVGFNRAAGAAKDRSPIARVDPDRALVSLKEMPITMVEASDDAGEVARRKIGGLSVERAPSYIILSVVKTLRSLGSSSLIGSSMNRAAIVISDIKILLSWRVAIACSTPGSPGWSNGPGQTTRM